MGLSLTTDEHVSPPQPMSSYCLLAESPYIKVVSDTWLLQGGPLAEQTHSQKPCEAGGSSRAPSSSASLVHFLQPSHSWRASITRPPEDSLASKKEQAAGQNTP